MQETLSVGDVLYCFPVSSHSWWSVVETGLCRPHIDFLDGSGESSSAYLYRYQGLALFYDWRPLEVLIDA